MTEPTTAAGRALDEWIGAGRRVVGEDWRSIHDDILTIEAEARAAALDEARAAVQDTRRSLTAGPGQDATDVHIAWALGEALAAIDALREDER